MRAVRTLPAALVPLALALAALPAAAEHTPQGRCEPPNFGMGIIAFSGGSAESTFYVDDRNYYSGNGIWIYEESNGIFVPPDWPHSLQRGGQSAYIPDDHEICVDDPRVEPDRLVF